MELPAREPPILLLYEAFPQAKREEDKVAGNLEKLDDELKGVADKLRNLGNSVADLAEKLRETQQEMPGMQEGEINETAEELAKALGDLPNANRTRGY